MMSPSEETLTEPQLEQPLDATASDWQAEKEALNQQYLRLAADFDNYRKRHAQEREQWFKYGAQSTLEALLPVLDNLARGQSSLSETSEPAMLYKSLAMLEQQLIDTLQSVGLEKMMPLGQPFDPAFHEAISQQPAQAGQASDTVIQVYQEGYLLKDKVLRHAKVVVAVSEEPAFHQPDDNPFVTATMPIETSTIETDA